MWLHRRGLAILTEPEVWKRIQLLRAHHSHPAYNKFFVHRFISKMAPKSGHVKISWRCRPCWRICRETDQKCPNCEQHWKKVADPTYVHKPPVHPQQAPTNPYVIPDPPAWSWNQWPTTFQDPTDQRRPSRSASRKLKKQEKAAKAKGKGYTWAEQPVGNPFYPSGPFPASGDQTSPFALTKGQPYSMPMTPTPWMPTGKPSTPPLSKSTQKGSGAASSDQPIDQETLEILKGSYPDISQAPPRIREMIERAEHAARLAWEKDFNMATSQLKTAKEVLANIRDAKNRHQDTWLKHLKESSEQWKDMLETYLKQKNHFEQLIKKTKKEMKEAEQQTHALSSNEDNVDTNAAQQEALEGEKNAKELELRGQVQNLLQQCVNLVTQDDAILVDDEEEDKDKPPIKRARSADPTDSI